MGLLGANGTEDWMFMTMFDLGLRDIYANRFIFCSRIVR